MTLRIVLGTVTVVVPVTVTVLDVCGYIAKVEGASMQPCLNPENEKSPDYVLLNKWAARRYEFKKGEVVSLSSPFKPDQKIVKRIIGLEGDTVRTLTYRRRYVKVPEGHCWLEGDNHAQSMDSNMFGPVSIGLLEAKASHIVWPPRRWRTLPVFIPDKQRLISEAKTMTKYTNPGIKERL